MPNRFKIHPLRPRQRASAAPPAAAAASALALAAASPAAPAAHTRSRAAVAGRNLRVFQECQAAMCTRCVLTEVLCSVVAPSLALHRRDMTMSTAARGAVAPVQPAAAAEAAVVQAEWARRAPLYWRCVPPLEPALPVVQTDISDAAHRLLQLLNRHALSSHHANW